MQGDTLANAYSSLRSVAMESVDDDFIVFIHPDMVGDVRRMNAVAHGCPIRRHSTAGGVRARRRARLRSWRPAPALGRA